jgi:hypothetical protein
VRWAVQAVTVKKLARLYDTSHCLYAIPCRLLSDALCRPLHRTFVRPHHRGRPPPQLPSIRAAEPLCLCITATRIITDPATQPQLVIKHKYALSNRTDRSIWVFSAARQHRSSMDPLRRAFSDLAHHASHLRHSVHEQLQGVASAAAAAADPQQRRQQQRLQQQLQRLPGLHAASTSGSGLNSALSLARRPRAATQQLPRRVSFAPPMCSLTQGLFGGGGKKSGQQTDGGGGGGGGGGADGGGGGASAGSGGGGGFGGKGGKGPKDEDERILISEVGGSLVSFVSCW